MGKFYTSSRRLIKTVKNFYEAEFYTAFKNITSDDIFLGWGRKKSGCKAVELAKKHGAKFLLLEDGLLRSLNLGFESLETFSIVSDDIGIYYDSTKASKLEHILNTYEFDEDILKRARQAIKLIKTYKISKYNNNKKVPKNLFKDDEKRVLIITQANNDYSLKYGQALQFNTLDMIQKAKEENNAKVYVKIHPDVLSGKKELDFDIKKLPSDVGILSENFNPIELLKYFHKVYTKTSTMGFEALIMGVDCVCYGMPFYAGWGLTTDMLKCDRRVKKRSVEELFAAFYLLYASYYNPYADKKSDIFDTIKTLHKYKNIENFNSNTLFFVNFTLWKRSFVRDFFKAKSNKIVFVSKVEDLKKFKIDKNDKILVWGALIKDEEIKKYLDKDVKIHRVEDGFVRSVFLGSDLTRAYSLVVDSKGLYMDSTRPSDLEDILQKHEFSKELLQRAKEARKNVVEHKFSKYNEAKHYEFSKDKTKGKKVILVPAQVEDDASVLLSSCEIKYLELIKILREKEPNAYILYKIHPDVLSGNRQGLKDEKLILKYCNEIIKEASIHSCLELASEVHTISSTVGFEALLREKKVFAYGMPFYAGWGLTTDMLKCTRRTRKLSLDELVAGVLLIYPRYINAKTKHLCEFESAFSSMLELRDRYLNDKCFAYANTLRNFALRKARRGYEKLAKSGLWN